METNYIQTQISKYEKESSDVVIYVFINKLNHRSNGGSIRM